MPRKMTLGHGTVAVSAALYDDMPTLILEEGRGSGTIGVPSESRRSPLVMYPDDDAIVLYFEHPNAVDVLIERLEEIRRLFDAEHRALIEHQQELYHEFGT